MCDQVRSERCVKYRDKNNQNYCSYINSTVQWLLCVRMPCAWLTLTRLILAQCQRSVSWPGVCTGMGTSGIPSLCGGNPIPVHTSSRGTGGRRATTRGVHGDGLFCRTSRPSVEQISPVEGVASANASDWLYGRCCVKPCSP